MYNIKHPVSHSNLNRQ